VIPWGVKLPGIKSIKPSLGDSYLKTTRAKEHLDALKGELDAFYKSTPYSFITEDDVERDRYSVRVEIAETPPRISLVVGDLFYCLRSALDQLVWALAHLNVPYPKGTQFPIQEQRDRKRFESQTVGVPPDAVKIIESLQPYHAGDLPAIRKHLLWRLNKMCNIDKHRRIPVHGDELFFKPEMPQSAVPLIEYDHDNARFSVPARFKDRVTLDSNDVSFFVVFGDYANGIACDIQEIQAIFDFVVDTVLPKFSGFFYRR
jgi:hypothetical protein